MYATVGMAFLTVILALGAIGNICVLNKQLDEARENDARQTRAWMVVSGTDFSVSADAQKVNRAAGWVTLRNTGNSPALHVHVVRCSMVSETEPDSEIPTGPNCQSTEAGLVGKDVLVPMPMHDPNFEVPATGIPEPRHFYYWGKISYQVTPDNSTHVTAFCLREAGSQLGPCSKGNEAN